MGFKTIGIVSGREKRDFVLSLGADECITYNDCKENDEIIVEYEILLNLSKLT